MVVYQSPIQERVCMKPFSRQRLRDGCSDTSPRNHSSIKTDLYSDTQQPPCNLFSDKTQSRSQIPDTVSARTDTM